MAREINVSRDGSFLRIESVKGSVTTIQTIALAHIITVNEFSYKDMPFGIDNTLETDKYLVQVSYSSTDGEIEKQEIDLSIEENQAGWTNTKAGVAQAISDIIEWVGDYAYGSGGSSGNALATESTLAGVLSILQQGKDWEGQKVIDRMNSNLIVQQRVTYDQDSQTYSIAYYEVDGTPYTPVGPLEYPDGTVDFTSLINAIEATYETDDEAIVSEEFLPVGGMADDSANYPNYSNGDAARLRIDEVNGGLKVNQANLDQTEDNVRVFQGTTTNQDSAASLYRSTTIDTTSSAVKLSPTNLYRVNVVNTSTDECVVKLYDSVSVDPTTDSPVYTISVPTGDGSRVREVFDIPLPFANGLIIRAVTGTGDTDETDITTAPIVEIMYK